MKWVAIEYVITDNVHDIKQVIGPFGSEAEARDWMLSVWGGEGQIDYKIMPITHAKFWEPPVDDPLQRRFERQQEYCR